MFLSSKEAPGSRTEPTEKGADGKKRKASKGGVGTTGQPSLVHLPGKKKTGKN